MVSRVGTFMEGAHDPCVKVHRWATPKAMAATVATEKKVTLIIVEGMEELQRDAPCEAT